MSEVARLWRYPVKSLAGEEVDRLAVDAAGVRGDRQWAFHDVERGVTASARRVPALLRLRARWTDPGVVVTSPDGAEHEPGPALDAAVSAYVDRELRLVPLPRRRAAHRLPWRALLDQVSPGAIARDLGVGDDERLPAFERMTMRSLLGYGLWTTPPGGFVDLAPLHVLTEASLRTVAGVLADEVSPDPRRFRPNVLVSGVEGELPESTWTRAVLSAGTAELAVTMPTVRCVVPSREQADVPLERRMTRAVATAGGRYLGCYAEVRRPGEVRVGDSVEVRPPEPPGPVRRGLAGVRRTTVRGAVRLAELARR